MIPDDTPSGLRHPSIDRPLRVAIVGAGKMGQHHARAIGRLGSSVRVVAVADPSESARAAILCLVPDAAGFASLEEAVAAGPVDAVHVCTAPETHGPLAAAALESGCHVYVEKPFCESVSTAERLIAMAATRRLKICAGHQLLYESPTRDALALLPALGNLVHVESYFSFRPVRRSGNGRAPLRSDLQLFDVLPHPVCLLLRIIEEASPAGRPELAAVETGPAGTVHALVRRGGITGTLVITLEGRPVESYLRIVGTNGWVHADFVRGTVQRLIGPGTSAVDKVLSPFRLGRQLLTGTSLALGRRVLKKQRSYPGLVEILQAFYDSITNDTAPPVGAENIVETVRICAQVRRALDVDDQAVESTPLEPTADRRFVVLTGGTGFLGKEIVRALRQQGTGVRVLARRAPPAWERIPGVDYAVADLSQPIPPSALSGADLIIHCAAATAGGWDEHQKHSIDATEHLLRAAATAGVERIIHVSSLAVLAPDNGDGPVREDTSLEPRSRDCGPYVWGKLESERLAVRLAEDLKLDLRVVRPGALVDYRSFEPPGRLGKRVGNVFVAVGAPSDSLGVIDVQFAAKAIAWIGRHFADAPATLNLLEPRLPTRRELLGHLKRSNPDLTVVWVPTVALKPLSWAATGLQKVLRPGTSSIDVSRVFGTRRYDTSRMSMLAPLVLAEHGEAIRSP